MRGHPGFELTSIGKFEFRDSSERITAKTFSSLKLQVLFLRDLRLTLGETYVLEWEVIRIDCHPEEHADQANCEARGCIWDVSKKWSYAHIHICFSKTQDRCI